MTLEQVYNQAKALPDEQRRQLADMILSDLRPELPNTFHNEAELEQMLLEGMRSPTHPVTEQTWEEIRVEVRKRIAARQTSGHK